MPQASTDASKQASKHKHRMDLLSTCGHPHRLTLFCCVVLRADSGQRAQTSRHQYLLSNEGIHSSVRHQRHQYLLSSEGIHWSVGQQRNLYLLSRAFLLRQRTTTRPRTSLTTTPVHGPWRTVARCTGLATKWRLLDSAEPHVAEHLCQPRRRMAAAAQLRAARGLPRSGEFPATHNHTSSRTV